MEFGPIPAAALTDPPLPARLRGETKRHLLAAVVSAILPGAGQLFLGQRQKAFWLLASFFALLLGFWPIRLLRFYAGFFGLCCGWIAVYSYAACSALRTPSRESGVRAPKLWLLAILPLSFITLSLTGAMLTRASGFRAFTVPSPSMAKTIQQGDRIVADMRYYHMRFPSRQDVVLFKRKNTFFIKRVIAIGGDEIQGRNGDILLNRLPVSEPYVEHASPPVFLWMDNFGPLRVPVGKFFVMGDNRDISLDSRSADFGFVDKESIVGKPLYIFASDRPGKYIR